MGSRPSYEDFTPSTLRSSVLGNSVVSRCEEHGDGANRQSRDTAIVLSTKEAEAKIRHDNLMTILAIAVFCIVAISLFLILYP